MSLEQQIESLNANFATLIGLLTSGEVPKAAGKKKAAATEQTQQTATPPAEPTSPSVSTAAQQSAASPSTITAGDITKVIIALCAKDKSACLAVLETFGVKRGGELKPEQLAPAHKALTAKLDELVKL